MPTNGKRVGATISKLSDKILWFDNIDLVKDLLNALVYRNPILEGKRISIMLNGKRALYYDPIPAGTIVQADYFMHHYEYSRDPKVISKMRPEPQRKEGFYLAASGEQQETKELTKNTETQQSCGLLATTEPETSPHKSVLLRFIIEKLDEKEPIEVRAMSDSVIRSYYNHVRKILLQKDKIHPLDKLFFSWMQVQHNPHWMDKIQSVIDNTPASITTFDITVRRKQYDPEAPRPIVHKVIDKLKFNNEPDKEDVSNAPIERDSILYIEPVHTKENLPPLSPRKYFTKHVEKSEDTVVSTNLEEDLICFDTL
ncbi:hypothetical protein ABW20_dc0100815 [Dactylellina cionopaga]|nr:hypothetical protein ABW20_dc0100815 [Dactylellina cionopaga]